MTASKVKMRLQGHEKFALREGWLNKGISIVKKDPMVFQGKEAPDEFGIGNNMVKSLRYWLKAFNLIFEKPGKGAFLTELAEQIKENDPYFEDIFTIWVLHSQLVRNLEEATSWYMFFNRCEVDELDKEKIASILCREISKYAMGQTFSANSVKNDLDVLISMYGRTRDFVDPEDKSISPFSQLGLIKNINGRYSKACPDGRSINEWEVLYELSNLMDGKDNISIEQAVSGECGIGKIYQLPNIIINDLLDKLEAMEYIRVDRTAGLDIIYRKTTFTPESIMSEYYKNAR